MFTKVSLKFYQVWIIIVFSFVVIAGVTVWLHRMTPTQSLFVNYMNKKTKSYNIIYSFEKKNITDKESNTVELEQDLKSFIIDEVTKVCSEVYPELDANYILAIIYHESRFNPDVINTKTNAIGLMQILPKWHTVRAQRLGVSLTDPVGNILVGCDILNEVYQQSGSFRYALNVYAGGYVYADAHVNTKSQFEKELDEIIASGVIQCR